MNSDFTPMEVRGTVVYLGRAGGFDVRHCPEPERLARFIVDSCNNADVGALQRQLAEVTKQRDTYKAMLDLQNLRADRANEENVK